MIEAHRKTIKDIQFKVLPLGFAKSRKALVRLGKTIGPAMAAAAAGADPESPEDMDGTAVAAAMGAFVERVTDEDLEWFAEVFGEKTMFSRDGEAWPFLRQGEREVLFGGGNLGMFFEWLMFCLEVNFSDFFDFVKRASGGAGPAESSPPS